MILMRILNLVQSITSPRKIKELRVLLEKSVESVDENEELIKKINQFKPKENENCLRCGRFLKDESSKVRGYGVICYKKMLLEQKIIPLFEIERLDK